MWEKVGFQAAKVLTKQVQIIHSTYKQITVTTP